MSSDFNDIVKQGYVRLKSKNVGVWRKKWVILRKASSKGPFRLEKYQDEKSSLLKYQSRHSKFINLTHVSTAQRLPLDTKKHAVAIVMLDGSGRQFCCDSDYEADEWMLQINAESTHTRNASASSSGSESLLPFLTPTKDKFNVCLLPSHALNFFGECIMHITSRDIDLYDAVDHKKLLASWPLTSLRRYGQDKSKFTFEAGRHCQTGEGLFICNTMEGPQIYHQVHVATLAIAEAHGMARRQAMMDEHSPLQLSLSSPVMSTTHTDSPNTDAKLRYSQSLPTGARTGMENGDRAPCPLPRDQARGPLPPVPAGENNNNNAVVDDTYMYSQTSPQSPKGRPLPALPPDQSPGGADTADDASAPCTSDQENNDPMSDGNKYLDPRFQQFLARWKEDP